MSEYRAEHYCNNIQKVPAPQFLARQERLIRTDEYQKMQEACSRLVNKQQTDREKQLMADRIMWKGYLTVKQRMLKLQKEADNKLKTQVDLGKWLSSISPYSNFVFAMTDMAGTGVASERHFRQSVMSFDQRYFGHFYDRLLKEEQDRWNPDNAPGFKYRFLSVSERLFIILPQIGLLLFWGVLLFVGAFVSFLKYDVR